MVNYCPKCGKANNDKDKFCIKCGTTLIETSSDSEYSNDNSLYKPDRGIYEMFFKFSGRINTKRYLIRVMLLILITYSIMFLTFILSPQMKIINQTHLFMMIGLLIMMIPLNIRRCHDLGRPGWYFLLLLIPILAGAVEVSVIKRKIWRNQWGEYFKYEESNILSLILAIFYFIFMSLLASLIFVFSSGMKGENQYGADPTGLSAKVPEQSNPILGFISKLEEETSSVVVGALLMILMLFPGLVVTAMSSINQSRINQQVAMNKQSNINQTQLEDVNAKKQEQTTTDVLDKVDENLKNQDVPASSEKTIFAKPLTSQAQNDAVYVFIVFHDNITKGNFRQAYDTCLSNELKSKMSYEGWIPGFKTTVSSSVDNIKVISENNNEIVLTYILTAVDQIKGKTQIEKFNGKVIMVNQNGSWKIDDTKNKIIK